MHQCRYCLEYKTILPPATKSKSLLYPDGRKLDWQFVCSKCNQAQFAWEQERNIEKFKLAETRRQWHKEVAERNAQRRADIEARREASERSRLSKLEAELPDLLAELESLRKKYFQNDDKNT